MRTGINLRGLVSGTLGPGLYPLLEYFDLLFSEWFPLWWHAIKLIR